MRFAVPVEVEGADQPRQTKEMISVQMADEDMADTAGTQSVPQQLPLGSLAAVDQQMMPVQLDILAAGMTRAGGGG